MRLSSFILVTSTAVSTCTTSAPGLVGSFLGEANWTNSTPLFDDGPDDTPVDRLVRVTTDTDERMLPDMQAAVNKLLLSWEDIKSVMVHKFGGINAHKLTPAGWSQVMDETEQLLKRLSELDRNAYMTEVKAISQTSDAEEGSLRLLKLISISESTYRSTMAGHIMTWMHQNPSGDLVKVLTQNGFFQHFSCAKVKALEMCLERSNDALLFNTLSEGFGGVDKFASLLSSAKLGPFTRHEAASYQHRLLASWHAQGKAEGDTVLNLLKLDTKPMTYETLDTLVEFIALLPRSKLTLDQARSKTISYLRKRLGDGAVVKAIMDGKMVVQSAGRHLRVRYNDISIALTNDDHSDYITKFEIELITKFFEDGKLPSYFETNPYGLPEEYNKQLREDYAAFFKEHEVLSLRPPGT